MLRIDSLPGFSKILAKIEANSLQIMMREAKRTNETYRQHAFSALGRFCEARDELDIASDVYHVVAPTVEELAEDGNDKTSGKTRQTSPLLVFLFP